jgi:PPP family 3-phenylpropionic acid transporter
VTAIASRRSANAGLRLAFVYAASFFEMGVQIPFLPVWLGARGLSDGEIAITLAAPLALRVVTTAYLSSLADRRRDVPGMLSAAAITLASACAMLGVLHGFAPLLAAVTVLLCAQGLIMPLADAIASLVLRANEIDDGAKLDYGRIRKWGSAAFIAGNLAGGLFLSVVPIDAAPIALTVSAMLGVAATLYAAPLAHGLAQAHAQAAEPATDNRLGLLPLVIAAAALIQTSHALLNTFGSIHWAREGHSSNFVGAAWATGVVCETTVFALAGRWFSGPDRALVLLGLGGGVATLRWLVMASDPGAIALLFAQAAHGVTFACTHLGSMLFIFAAAPPQMRARAQGWLTAAISGLSALLMALCGPLYAHFGEVAYLAMAGLSASGLTLAIIVSARKR